MTRYGHLRASDADRDLVAERLRTAATEGRIATDELDERLGATLTARTYGELEALVADLPGTPARRHTGSPMLTVAKVALALAILIPVMLAVLFVVTGILAGWLVWLIAAWWFFGRRRRPRQPHDYYYYRGPRGIERHAGPVSGRGFRP
jgi:hypothetical protein